MVNVFRNKRSKLILKKIIGYLFLFTSVLTCYSIWAIGLKAISNSINIPIIITTILNRTGGIAICICLAFIAGKIAKNRDNIIDLIKINIRSVVDFLIGLLIGSIGMFVLFMIYQKFNWLTISRVENTKLTISTIFIGIISILFTNGFTAITEEIIYRGYLLNAVSEIWNTKTSLFIMALIFSIHHLVVSTSNETPLPLFILSIIGPGIMLGWAFIRTNKLWLPIGIHLMWNLMQDDVLNIPGRIVDGNSIALRTIVSGPKYLIGTEYGIETGLMGLIPLLICFLLIEVYHLLCNKVNNQTAAST